MAKNKDEENFPHDNDKLPDNIDELLEAANSDDLSIVIVRAAPLEVLKETQIAPGIILLTFIEPHLNNLITTRVLCADNVEFSLKDHNRYGKTKAEALKNHEEIEFYALAELQFAK
ncbi:MAG: hypothetical protein V3V74_07585 [Nitrosomonadaceae bacterium]